MWGEFFKATGGKLAERGWGLGAASLTFWAGLAAFWVAANGGAGVLAVAAVWLGAQPSIVQIAVAVVVVLAAAVPGIVVARLTTPVLRLLEGYGPAWPEALRKKRIEALRQRHSSDVEAWQRLQSAVMSGKQVDQEERASHARLDRLLHLRPADPAQFMATKIGNILKAAEQRPRDKYGLDTVIVWPRLWLVMPDTARQELASARRSLDASVAAAVWAALFAVVVLALLGFSPVHAWWLGGVGFLSGTAVAASVIYWWVPNRASVFGALVESAFDLYRFGLYEQLRWPAPSQPATEQSSGRVLTAYLWRGHVPDSSTFFTTLEGS